MSQTLTVFHSSNIIEDICIVNGLCRLLDINGIDYVVGNSIKYYRIEHKKFDYKDAFFISIDENDMTTCNSSFNLKNRKSFAEFLNKFFDKYIYDVLMYFSTHDEIYEKKLGSTFSINIGNFFNSRGIRGTSSPRPLKTSTLKRSLSFLGWIYSATYISDNTTEINSLIIPKLTDRIIKPYEFKFIDKDTNEEKIRKIFGKNYKKTDIIITAEIYVNTMREYLTYVGTEKGNCKINCIVFMLLKKGGKKPLPNNFIMLPIYQYRTWNKEIYMQFSKILDRSFIDFDVRNTLSMYILYPTLSNFSKLIHVFSAKKQLLEISSRKGLIEMYDNKVQEIHNSEAVKKLGKGLHYMMSQNIGYEILAKLYNTKNVKNLASRVREIEDVYFRFKKKFFSKYTSLLTDTEHEEIINLIETNEDAAICSDAIISYARVFFEKKKESISN